MFLVIDSNLLIGDSRFQHRVWQLLAGRPESWGLNVRIPRVVQEEVVAHCQREMQTAHGKLQADVRAIRKYGLEIPGADSITTEIDQMIAGEPERFTGEFASKRIHLLEMPDVDHNVLVRRAVQRVRPYNNNGKGYRDTLIWFTLLDLMDAHPAELIVFASENFRDFAAGTGRLQYTLHQDLLADIHQRGHDPGIVKYLVGLDELQDFLISEHKIAATSPILSTYAVRLAEQVIQRLSSEPFRSLDIVECGLPLSLRHVDATLTKANNLGAASITELEGFEAFPYEIIFQGECTLKPSPSDSVAAPAPVEVVSKPLLAKGDIIINASSGVEQFTIDSIQGVDGDVDVIRNRETMDRMIAAANVIANAFARDVGTQLAVSRLSIDLQHFADAAAMGFNSSGAIQQIAESIVSSPGIKAAQARLGEIVLTGLRRKSEDAIASRAVADTVAQVAALDSSTLDAMSETAKIAGGLDTEAVRDLEKLARRAQEVDVSDVRRSAESAKRFLGE